MEGRMVGRAAKVANSPWARVRRRTDEVAEVASSWCEHPRLWIAIHFLRMQKDQGLLRAQGNTCERIHCARACVHG